MHRRTLALLCIAGVVIAGACTRDASGQTTGLIPIIDLGTGTYEGFEGGLYPGGSNAPPAGHLADALAYAAQIVPRAAGGSPDPNGWIAMIAVGMSNTTHEFGAFERDADADTARNARVVIVDTGFGGQTATIIANPAATYWTTMMQRLAALGLTADQVQVAWLKEAEAHPLDNFPVHAQQFRDTLKHVVRNLHDFFPNVRLCYVSSRIYGGYAPPGSLSPEPQAYESGFGVKWLIEDQIGGDPELNHGQLPGDVRAPLLLWGPYLWADGIQPRSDGLTWQPADLENDDVHPSPSGEQKVAGLLHEFFESDATASPWWPAQPGARLVTVDAIHDAYVSAAAPSSNFGAAPTLIAQGGASPIRALARFDVGGETRPLLRAKLSARITTNGQGGGALRPVDDTSWDESTVTYATAPAIGAVLVSLPPATRDGTIGADVTALVASDADRQIGFALTTTTMGQTIYHSREGGQPPRLVLTVATPVDDVPLAAASAARLSAPHPNPSAGRSRVTFELPVATRVDLAVFAVTGRRVATLARGTLEPGVHAGSWDGHDARGRPCAPGIYLVSLATPSGVTSAKLIRIR